MDYRGFSIHCATFHDIVERWSEGSQLDGARELHTTWREGTGKKLQRIPADYIVEEVNDCPVCNGEDSGGKNLRLVSDTLLSNRYHMASCLYEHTPSAYLKKFQDLNPPDNINEDGSLKDVMGPKISFKCNKSKACPKSRMGFKSYVIHQAQIHGVLELEEILKDHPNPDVRQILPKLISA